MTFKSQTEAVDGDSFLVAVRKLGVVLLDRSPHATFSLRVKAPPFVPRVGLSNLELISLKCYTCT